MGKATRRKNLRLQRQLKRAQVINKKITLDTLKKYVGNLYGDNKRYILYGGIRQK